MKRVFLEAVIGLAAKPGETALEKADVYREIIKNDLKGKPEIRFIRNIDINKFKFQQYDSDDVLLFHYEVKQYC